MNSDSESDWDSMSEAPKIPQGVNQQGLVIYPPGPSIETDEKKNGKLPHKQPLVVPPPKPPPTTPPKTPENNFRQKSNILAQQAAAKVSQKKARPEAPKSAPVPKVREIKNNLPNPSLSLKDSSGSGSRDSGIDTSTIPSTNNTPSNAKFVEKQVKEDGDSFDDIVGGHDNLAFDTDSYDSSEPKLFLKQPKHLPVPDERINLLSFEEIKTKYFQIQVEDEGLIVDKIIPPVAECCSKIISESLGLLKLPLIIMFVILGNILRVLISSLLRPFSDYIFKPLLVSVHNLILSPLFSLLFNIFSMMATTISPCCNLVTFSKPWHYVKVPESDEETQKQIQIQTV